MEFDIKQILITKDKDTSSNYEICEGDIVYCEFKTNEDRESIVGKVITIYSDGLLIDGSLEYEANRREVYLKDLLYICKYDK